MELIPIFFFNSWLIRNCSYSFLWDNRIVFYLPSLLNPACIPLLNNTMQDRRFRTHSLREQLINLAAQNSLWMFLNNTHIFIFCCRQFFHFPHLCLYIILYLNMSMDKGKNHIMPNHQCVFSYSSRKLFIIYFLHLCFII